MGEIGAAQPPARVDHRLYPAVVCGQAVHRLLDQPVGDRQDQVVLAGEVPAAAIALAVAYMPYVARVLRGAALKERSQPYVAALEVQGASAVSICFRHLIPNMMPLIVAQATILFGYAMVDLAAISFLGLGVQPPEPNWGVMISENQVGIPQGYPLPALVACACIVVVVIAVNVLGERLFEQAQRTHR
jgi:peptide/nickel transport system permease protein